jgi:hypothetical protein
MPGNGGHQHDQARRRRGVRHHRPRSPAGEFKVYARSAWPPKRVGIWSERVSNVSGDPGRGEGPRVAGSPRRRRPRRFSRSPGSSAGEASPPRRPSPARPRPLLRQLDLSTGRLSPLGLPVSSPADFGSTRGTIARARVTRPRCRSRSPSPWLVRRSRRGVDDLIFSRNCASSPACARFPPWRSRLGTNVT